MINKKAEWSLESTFESIDRVAGCFVVSNSNKFGLLRSDLVELLPLEYEKIEKFDEEYFKLTKNGDIFYYSISKSEFVKPKLDS